MRSYTKFSPGTVPEPNHTKTPNMCLVNSYFLCIFIWIWAPFQVKRCSKKREIILVNSNFTEFWHSSLSSIIFCRIKQWSTYKSQVFVYEFYALSAHTDIKFSESIIFKTVLWQSNFLSFVVIGVSGDGGRDRPMN